MSKITCIYYLENRKHTGFANGRNSTYVYTAHVNIMILVPEYYNELQKISNLSFRIHLKQVHILYTF